MRLNLQSGCSEGLAARPREGLAREWQEPIYSERIRRNSTGAGAVTATAARTLEFGLKADGFGPVVGARTPGLGFAARGAGEAAVAEHGGEDQGGRRLAVLAEVAD